MSAVTIINTPHLSSITRNSIQQITIYERDYLLLNSNDIYELQTASPNGGKYASFIVASRFIADDNLYVGSRVDPLFFVLHYFTGNSNECTNEVNNGTEGTKWQPWDQMLANLPPIVFTALGTSINVTAMDQVGQMAHLLDVSDVFDDEIVCKFSQDKALRWLNAKFDRTVGALRKHKEDKKRRAAERKRSGEFGAFNSSFVLAEEAGNKTEGANLEKTDVELTGEEEHGVKIASLQLLSDYLPPIWTSKLAKSLDLSEQEIVKKQCTPTQKAAEKRSWEGAIGQAEAEELTSLTMGQGTSSVITPAEKSVMNAQSVGLKRLAKVNTKGMKSLSSFFGGGKKKIKKEC